MWSHWEDTGANDVSLAFRCLQLLQDYIGDGKRAGGGEQSQCGQVVMGSSGSKSSG